MQHIREKTGYIIDMDGVIYHGSRLLPGVAEFVDWLYRKEKKFLFISKTGHREQIVSEKAGEMKQQRPLRRMPLFTANFALSR